MTFAYHNIVDPTDPNGAISYPMTDNNIPPALVLWLFVTTNPTFVADPSSGGLDAAARQNIADQLGITKYTVDHFIDIANQHSDEFSTVSAVFASMGNSAGYSGKFCPKVASTILTLAPSAKVADPGK